MDAPNRPDERGPRPRRLRRTVVGRLPPERPRHVIEREWSAISGVAAGQTMAEVAAELGISRQRVAQLVALARAKLAR